MRNMKQLLGVVFLLLTLATFASGQTALTSTTLSAAVSSSSTTTIVVASATGITAGTTGLYVDREFLDVNAVSGTTITVRRGASGTAANPHISGAVVLVGPKNLFQAYDPDGACTAASTLVTPWVNIKNGNQWLCSTVVLKWVPGFGNTSAPIAPTAAVASAAGLITPSGPLLHITGTAAITGFTVPVGFGQGTICSVPDAIFTTTTANNIALASTAVVSKILCWTYDKNANKFYPTY